MEYCPYVDHATLFQVSYAYRNISGGDLYAAIKRGQMSQAEINSYFKQMMLGVTYLHSMGVAHRDIKVGPLLF